jgi:hypothetical protein
MFLSLWRRFVERTLPTSRPLGGRFRSPRLHCEELEPRDVPSASAFSTGIPHGRIATIREPSNARVALAAPGNTNGAAGEIPAFFNGQLVTINVKELPDNAEAFALLKNPRVRTIYVTNDLDDPQEFHPVINAIPGQNFNALWHQVQISFTGSTPHQFTSEADILAAAAAHQITLIDTGEVYRDSVVGGGLNA